MKPVDLSDILNRVTLRYMVRALKATNGCREHAAKLLGIKRSTLFMKMRAFDLLEKYPAPSRWRKKPKEEKENIHPYGAWADIEDCME